MNIKITAEYNGEEFELVIGEKYEFLSDEAGGFAKEFVAGELVHCSIWEDTPVSCCFAVEGENEVRYAKAVRPIQKPKTRLLTHKEIAMNLVGKGVFRVINEYDDWVTPWSTERTIQRWRFSFFSDLDTDHGKWHDLTSDLLDLLNKRA